MLFADRMVVRYLERQTVGKPPNPVQKALFCVIKCFLRCLECCLDKINKYSLSWTAVYGDGFCISVCSSFALVWRNLFRVAAVNTVLSLYLSFFLLISSLPCFVVHDGSKIGFFHHHLWHGQVGGGFVNRGLGGVVSARGRAVRFQCDLSPWRPPCSASLSGSLCSMCRVCMAFANWFQLEVLN